MHFRAKKKSLIVILFDKQGIPHILAENLKGPLNVRLGRVIAWVDLELRANASPCLIAPVGAGGYGFSGGKHHKHDSSSARGSGPFSGCVLEFLYTRLITDETAQVSAVLPHPR